MSGQYPFDADRFILIGHVLKPHGLKGDLKIKVLSGQPENLQNYSRLALVAEDGRMTALLDVAGLNFSGRQVILKLDTIENRREADLTSGMGVLVPREDLPDLHEDEFYLHEFEGLPVILQKSEKPIGHIDGFFSNGAHDIMIIRDGDIEYLVPLLDHIVVSYDKTRVIIDPPEGLLEIYTPEGP